MKFLVIFISLSMIIFGALFSYCTYDISSLNKIKGKLDFNNLPTEKQCQVNTLMKNISNNSFIAFVIGICLFIAGLFI